MPIKDRDQTQRITLAEIADSRCGVVSDPAVLAGQEGQYRWEGLLTIDLAAAVQRFEEEGCSPAWLERHASVRAARVDNDRCAVWGAAAGGTTARSAGAGPWRSLAGTRPSRAARPTQAFTLRGLVERARHARTLSRYRSVDAGAQEERAGAVVAGERIDLTWRRAAPPVDEAAERSRGPGASCSSTNLDDDIDPLATPRPKANNHRCELPRHWQTIYLSQLLRHDPRRGASLVDIADQRPRFSNLCRERARAHA